jgi:hypothetical protein
MLKKLIYTILFYKKIKISYSRWNRSLNAEFFVYQFQMRIVAPIQINYLLLGAIRE